MALGAFCEESPAPPGFAKRILGMASCGQSLGFGETQAACVEMRFMALKAEKRLVLFEHIISHGPMGIVTNGAIFYNRCMFENKGALFVRMTIKAKIVDPLDCFQIFHQRTMMLVTAAAFHFSLTNGVARREVDFGCDIPVTIQAKLRILFDESLLIMNRMAA